MSYSDLFYIDQNGYHTSDYPTVLAYITSSFQGIYGADVYLGPDSQDGEWLAILAKGLYDAGMNGLASYNSLSPLGAQGVGLSRGVKLNGLTRQDPTFSTADLTLIGQSGVTLNRAVAIDSLQQKWIIPDGTTFPSGGSIVVTATAAVAGAVSAAANTITGIFTPTLGWQSVNNAAAATVGVAVESDAQLRIRQSMSTANPSLTVFDGTKGAVANVAGVTQSRGYENDSDSTDGNGITPHSICMVVEGGTISDICQAIQVHKTPGTNTYGSTSQLVYDAHGMPLTIRFQRPTLDTISVVITIAATVGWSSDYETIIQQSVASYINSIGIGNNVLYTKIFVPAYVFGTPAAGTFDITAMTVNGGTSNISTAFDHLPTCDPASDVTIIVT